MNFLLISTAMQDGSGLGSLFPTTQPTLVFILWNTLTDLRVESMAGSTKEQLFSTVYYW